MDTIKVKKGNTLFVAHRGLSGIETENTAAAFIAAAQRTYFGIETDIHKTLDGIFVCCHDSDLARVSGLEPEKYIIEQMTYEALCKLHLLDKHTRKVFNHLCIPTLDEYITICQRYNKHCVAEIKGSMDASDIEKITELFKSHDYLDSTTFISFDIENLIKVRAYYPDQSVQYLTGDLTEQRLERVCLHGMDVDLHAPCITQELISRLHSKGIVVNCWTVDNEETALRLISLGVDQITTNILE